jgi:hypothetical protein
MPIPASKQAHMSEQGRFLIWEAHRMYISFRTPTVITVGTRLQYCLVVVVSCNEVVRKQASIISQRGKKMVLE